MHSLTQTPNGILQSNPVIYWGMQDLKNMTKIPSTFLLSRAGLEQQQHYGYFLQPLHQHSGICTVSDLQPHSSTRHMLSALPHRREKGYCNVDYRHGSPARKQCSVLINEGKKPNHRSQVKWWYFSWEQHTQQAHHPLQGRKFQVSLL